MKNKKKPTYRIVSVSVKKSPDNKEIYDCTSKEKSEYFEEASDDVNLSHYRNIAVLKEKRENTKKKNLVYTVFKELDGKIEILTLTEGDFVKYMTRADFKLILNNFLKYENALQQKAKEEE